MCIVEHSEYLKNEICKLINSALTVFRLHTAECDVMYAMLTRLHNEARHDVFSWHGICILLIEGEEELVSASEAVYPIPKAVEPCKLTSLKQSFGRIVRDLAAGLFNKKVRFLEGFVSLSCGKLCGTVSVVYGKLRKSLYNYGHRAVKLVLFLVVGVCIVLCDFFKSSVKTACEKLCI